MSKIKGIIFDLDGVITDTAKFHFDAWAKLGKSLGIDLPIEFEENLKGIDRPNSLKRILEYGNVKLDEATFNKKLDEKNNNYIESLSSLSEKDILPGIVPFIKEAKAKGIKIALASVSKNAPMILKKLKLDHEFDYVCDPSTLKAGKPDPEIFVNCANALGLKIEDCIGVEDAVAGVESINGSGMFSLGIGLGLTKATQVLESTKDLKLQNIKY